MKFIRGNCEYIRLLETLLQNTLGNRMVLSDGVHNELWEEQRSFESKSYKHSYQITADKKAWFICKWFDVTFYYDERPGQDVAFIDINRENLDKLQDLINAAAKTKSSNNIN